MSNPSLQTTLCASILDAVEIRGSLLLSEAIECLKPIGFQVGEIRAAVDHLLREQRITARPYNIRPFSLDLRALKLDIELRKKGLPV